MNNLYTRAVYALQSLLYSPLLYTVFTCGVGPIEITYVLTSWHPRQTLNQSAME